MKEVDMYQGWPILDDIPDGWKIDKTVGSPLHDCVFITNGKSVLNGQKRALLRVFQQKEKRQQIDENLLFECEQVLEIEDNEEYVFPAMTVNLLAREKFKEHLLKDILTDLMICEIEGWDKKVYITELQSLINEIEV